MLARAQQGGVGQLRAAAVHQPGYEVEYAAPIETQAGRRSSTISGIVVGDNGLRGQVSRISPVDAVRVQVELIIAQLKNARFEQTLEVPDCHLTYRFDVQPALYLLSACL